MSHPFSRQASHSFSQPRSGPDCPDLENALERALREVLVACQQACEARRGVPQDAPEWHKRTGEILAYGRFTRVLSDL